MKTRNCNLDLIKCLACLGVVGLHSVGMVNYTIYYLCGISVPLFFMVNGYLMFSRSSLPYSYALRKIRNLLIPVAGWNILIMIPVMVVRHKFVNPITLCLKSLFQQGYLWHFWFFGSLMLIYLVMPMLYRLLRDHPLALSMVCMLLALCSICISLLSMQRGYSIQQYVPQTLRLWTWLFFFLFGGLCAVKAEKNSLLLAIHMPLWLHGILVLLLAILNNFCIKKTGLYLIHNRLADLFYDNPSSVLWYTVTFLFLLRLPIHAEKAKALIVSLCSLTMGIFILHPILLAGISAVYVPDGTFSAVVLWLSLTVISGAVTFVIGKIPFVNLLIRT